MNPDLSVENKQVLKICLDSSNSSFETLSDVKTVTKPLKAQQHHDPTFKLYYWRWMILICYCLLTLSAGSSWLCFPAISSIMQRYYNTTGLLAVNMLSIAFGIAIVLFSIPFGVILDKYGLAVVLRISAFMNLSGAIVRYYKGSDISGYTYLLVGNILTAISVAGFLFLPGKIAASWFAHHELGIATSICIGFDALGTGIGFIHSTRMIHNSNDTTEIHDNMKTFLLSQLIPAAIVFVFVILFARKQPKTPPNLLEREYQNHLEYNKKIKRQFVNINESHQRLSKKGELQVNKCSNSLTSLESFASTYTSRGSEVSSLKSSMFILLKNINFQLIIHMQGIAASIEGVYELLLNEMLIGIYPGKEQAIGMVGFVSIFCSFLCNIIIGLIVDRTGSCKKVSFLIFLVTLVCAIMWYVLISFVHCFLAKAFVFCLLMSSVTCYYTVAFTHSSQLSLSVSPSAIGVMLVFTSQIYDSLMSLLSTKLLECFGVEGVNLFAIFLCFTAVILSFLIRKHKTLS